MEILKSIRNIEIVKSSSNYFISQLLNKAQGFITIPIFTRILSPADYGYINVYYSLLGILVIISSLNLQSGISRYYYEKKGDFDQFLSTTFLTISATTIIFSIFILLFKRDFVTFFDIPNKLVLLLTLTLIVSYPTSVLETILVVTKQSKKYLVFTSSNAYIGVIFAIIFVLLAENNKYFYRIVGSSIILALYAAIATYWLLKNHKINCFSINALKYNLSYSIPLLPYALSSIVLGTIDRIVLMKYASADEAGIYSLSYNVGMLTLLAVVAANQAFLPNFFEWMNNKQDSLIAKSQELITYAVALFAIFLVYFSNELVVLLSAKSFHGAISLIPIIVAGYVCFLIAHFTNHYFVYFKRTGLLALTNVSVGILNLGLNIWLVPIYGKTSSAWITLLSFLLLAIINLFLIRRLFPSIGFSLLNISNPLAFFVAGISLFVATQSIESYVLSLSLRLLFILIILYYAYPRIKALLNE